MLHDVRAEILAQSRRPAHYLLLCVAVVLNLTFSYLVPYLSYAGGPSGRPDGDRGLEAMLPDAFVASALGGMPVFVGALSVVFGVLVAGSDYAWETWKTVLSQQGSRISVFAAKVLVITLGTAVLVVALFVADAGAGVLVAGLEDRSASMPEIAEVATGFAAATLVCTMWAMLGAVLAIALRGVALPIGLGLVWMLAVQNLLTALAAPLLDWVAEAQKYLPGPNVGSLVAGLGAFPGTPGVSSVMSSTHATLVAAVYLAGSAVVAGWLLHRRDIA